MMKSVPARMALTPTVKHFGINYFFFSDSSCRFFWRERRHRAAPARSPAQSQISPVVQASIDRLLEGLTLLKRLPTLAEVADTAAFLANSAEVVVLMPLMLVTKE